MKSIAIIVKRVNPTPTIIADVESPFFLIHGLTNGMATNIIAILKIESQGKLPLIVAIKKECVNYRKNKST